MHAAWRWANLAFISTGLAVPAIASDHLDTPSVIADPRADIGDLYGWMSPDRTRLNLAMTIVGHSFSDKLAYIFHIDSGARIGRTTRTTDVVCRFDTAQHADCRAGADRAHGDVREAGGLESEDGSFRLFAGLRDDPFFNNVKGTREAYNVVVAALGNGTRTDAAACPLLDAATSARMLDAWRHTGGGPAKNLLAGWTPDSIVISIDVRAINAGGRLLGIWATTENGKGQIDRAGRPLTANALFATFGPDDVGDKLKEAFNRATPATGAQFVPELEKGLALYDGFDGKCGNQPLIASALVGPARYRALAELLADDRLWVNSGSGRCEQFMAVELATLMRRREMARDCGGRTPIEDSTDVYRAVLINGTTTGASDGVGRDEREHSDRIFPFLAAPEVRK
jgi:hypothetical protein